MNRRTLQYAMGYVIGGSVFLVLIPFGLVALSRSLDQYLPFHPIGSSSLRYAVSIGLLTVGLLFGIWSNVTLNTKGQGGPLEFVNIEVSPRSRHLVTAGPYRYTRNPMLFGTCVLYYGVAVLLDSPVVLGVVTLYLVLMVVFVKRTEERRLSREFGDEFARYRRSVSPFVPWPKGRRSPRRGTP